jgi:diguanylate cyclase (GGDEF)-like protein
MEIAMNDGLIKILLIDDSAGDARLIEHMLTDAKGFSCELEWADSLTAGIERLRAGRIDVLLLDLGLPESRGLDTVQRLHAQIGTVPTLVVLSGLADEHVAMQALQSGAQDYLIKGQIDSALLVRSIRYAVERSQAREALQQAAAELERRVEERTAALANAVNALHAEIGERKQAEGRIRYMAHHDALTDLPNRVLLQDRIEQAIASAERNRAQVAVLFIDLDNFKHINDSLGHQVGDRLLQLVAARLRLCLRKGDSVARLGGDEFVLSLPSPKGGSDIARVAQKVLDALDRSFLVDGHDLHLGCSIGISVYPDDGNNVEALMRAADTAMYHAKESGRGNYQFFTSGLNRAAQNRLEIETRLRRALARNEFALHYQPQVNIASGAIFSAEALLRLPEPDGKEPTSFVEFITVAEETGLILAIGEWVLREACQQLKRWHNEGYPALRIAVNLSSRQFLKPDLVGTIIGILHETGVPASALDLELTESLLLQRNEDNVAMLTQLRDIGVQLSMDDFGTGYSSLAYLQRFPLHALKIDRSFVRGIDHSGSDTSLVTAIIAMARSLHLEVLAEGVETAEQESFLKSRGCLAAQGFYYSPALPADAFTELLRQGRYAGPPSPVSQSRRS